jgi:hypothetical protein
MGASLMEQRRVSEDGLRVVKLCLSGRGPGRSPGGTVPAEEAPANYVPAAAVRRRGQALSGITGRKGRVGGGVRSGFKPSAHPTEGR